MRHCARGDIVKTYIVETTDGEKVRQPYLATADDVRHALGEWLGDMGTERDVQRIYANARAMAAISYSEFGQGYKFINRFEPFDYLVTYLDSPECRALEAWILENDVRNQRAPLGDSIMAAWLASADEGQGIVEIPDRWSVTGATVTFDVWGAAP
jgi:hypothetical protein